MCLPKYSLVFPLYNEELNLPELYRRVCLIMDQLDTTVEFIYVNDGSRDRTLEILRE